MKTRGLLHQTVNHETMFFGIDVGIAGMGNHEVKAVRRQCSIEQMVRRARVLIAWLALRIAERAHDIFSNRDRVP